MTPSIMTPSMVTSSITALRIMPLDKIPLDEITLDKMTLYRAAFSRMILCSKTSIIMTLDILTFCIEDSGMIVSRMMIGREIAE
jgi:hypothetical protein